MFYFHHFCAHFYKSLVNKLTMRPILSSFNRQLERIKGKLKCPANILIIKKEELIISSHQWGRYPPDRLTLRLRHGIFLGRLLAGLVEGLDEVRWNRDKSRTVVLNPSSGRLLHTVSVWLDLYGATFFSVVVFSQQELERFFLMRLRGIKRNLTVFFDRLRRFPRHGFVWQDVY